MSHVQRTHFSARSYELDSYRHVNNAVYLSWFEQARLEFLLALGFSYDGFADREQWFVVARTEVDFRRPLHLGDELTVVSCITGFGRSSVRWLQRMQRNGAPAAAPRSGPNPAPGPAPHPEPSELVAEARSVMVFSGAGGGSIDVPEDFRAAVGTLAEPS